MSKNKISLFFLFILLSFSNILVFLGNNPISSFLVGQLIIILIIQDIDKSPYHFHVYQIILIYFYYSLVLSHSFNSLSINHSNYEFAYLINLLHFVFFISGYIVFNYRFSPVTKIPKQNYILFVIGIFSLTVMFFNLLETSTIGSYKSQVASFESKLDLPIYRLATQWTIEHFVSILLFFMSYPPLWALYWMVEHTFSFIQTGVKAGIVEGGLLLILTYQFFVKRISNTMLLALLPCSIVFLNILIGTTSFRGNLGLEGFLSLDFHRMINYLSGFFNQTESSHIVFTAKLLDILDRGQTSIRYGFDYWRFFAYPIRNLFNNFEYSSYNQFIHILSGKKVNVGVYIGLAGELYWNFSFFFFLFSFLHGALLKKFTNWAFSGNIFGIVTYLLFNQVIIWHLYRGYGNTLIMKVIFYIVGFIGFLLFWNFIKYKKFNFIMKYLVRFKKI